MWAEVHDVRVDVILPPLNANRKLHNYIPRLHHITQHLEIATIAFCSLFIGLKENQDSSLRGQRRR
jgi:hypothetical protein